MSEGKPLRIMHLVSYPLYSGALPPALGLALAQRRLGHTVHFAYDTKRGAFNPYEEAATAVVEASGLSAPLPMTLSTKSTPWQAWRDLCNLRRMVRDPGIDILHLHQSHDHTLAVASGAHRRTTLVRTLHALRSLRPRPGRRFLHRRIAGWITRCEAHRDSVREAGMAAGGRAAVIAGSVDANLFRVTDAKKRREARERFALPQDAKVLIHVALIAGRGQEELAGAAVRVNSPNLHLMYVGRGEAEQALALLTTAIGLEGKAHFPGYLPAARLRQAYAAADAAFLAQAGNDASVRAALEAMASGLPVIAVTNDALGELVTRERGYPVSTRAPTAIAEAITTWLRDADAVNKGTVARRFVEQERTFALEAQRTVAFYRELLTSRG